MSVGFVSAHPLWRFGVVAGAVPPTPVGHPGLGRKRAEARRRAQMEQARLSREAAEAERLQLEADARAVEKRIGKLKARKDRAEKQRLRDKRKAILAKAVEAEMRSALAQQAFDEAMRQEMADTAALRARQDEIAILLLMG